MTLYRKDLEDLGEGYVEVELDLDVRIVHILESVAIREGITVDEVICRILGRVMEDMETRANEKESEELPAKEDM